MTHYRASVTSTFSDTSEWVHADSESQASARIALIVGREVAQQLGIPERKVHVQVGKLEEAEPIARVCPDCGEFLFDEPCPHCAARKAGSPAPTSDLPTGQRGGAPGASVAAPAAAGRAKRVRKGAGRGM